MRVRMFVCVYRRVKACSYQEYEETYCCVQWKSACTCAHTQVEGDVMCVSRRNGGVGGGVGAVEERRFERKNR